MNTFSAERSEAIERALVRHVAEHPHRRRRTAWSVGLLLSGALAGAGVSAGAFAATGMLQPAETDSAGASSETSQASLPEGQPTPDLPDAVEAPAGVTPGSPVIALLGEPVTRYVDASMEVSLAERPSDATHARVTVIAASPGSLHWGTDPSGNNASARWTEQDLDTPGSAWTSYDSPLDATVDILYLEPDGFTGTVTVQYVTHVPTLFGANERGQTYGASGTGTGEPDLVAVVATNGREGYVDRAELDEATGETAAAGFTSPEDALRWQEERAGKIFMIPVYASDGVTKIGVFEVG